MGATLLWAHPKKKGEFQINLQILPLPPLSMTLLACKFTSNMSALPREYGIIVFDELCQGFVSDVRE